MAKMVLGRKFVLKQHFDGLPKVEDFEIVEEELGELQDGEIIFKSEYISVDPYQRAYSRRFTPPMTMIGSSVAKVMLQKKSANYFLLCNAFLDETL